jgi:hypothetical protein
MATLADAEVGSTIGRFAMSFRLAGADDYQLLP